MELEKVDFTKYPEGPKELVKYLEFMPDDEDARLAAIWGMVGIALRY